MREGNSPSWFNPVEAVQVMLVVPIPFLLVVSLKCNSPCILLTLTFLSPSQSPSPHNPLPLTIPSPFLTQQSGGTLHAAAAGWIHTLV